MSVRVRCGIRGFYWLSVLACNSVRRFMQKFRDTVLVLHRICCYAWTGLFLPPVPFSSIIRAVIAFLWRDGGGDETTITSYEPFSKPYELWNVFV
jgi:hypothetical protein